MGGQMGMGGGSFGGGGGGGGGGWNQQPWGGWNQMQMMPPPQQQQQSLMNLGMSGNRFGSTSTNPMAMADMPGGGYGDYVNRDYPSWMLAMDQGGQGQLGAQPGFSNMRGEGSLSNWWNNAAPWQQEMFPQYEPGGVNTLMMKPGGMPGASWDQGGFWRPYGDTNDYANMPIQAMGGRGQEGMFPQYRPGSNPGGAPTPDIAGPADAQGWQQLGSSGWSKRSGRK